MAMDTIGISINTWAARSMLTVNVGQTPGPQFSPRLLWVKPSDASTNALVSASCEPLPEPRCLCAKKRIWNNMR
jgi:hypothetical protein